ncbi:MAG: metal ABC transporter ATP-binding protein, partial [Armatimonadota bacterium]
GRRMVLTDLNLVVRAGDFLGIVGPNGAGKTTILKTMLGILRPLGGRVRRAPGIRFGYVPQRQSVDEIYPLTALEVAMMGRYPMMGIFRRPSRRDRDLVLRCLEHVGVAHLANRPYRELSGGQKQRTLIARALASEPGVLVLDEPTSDMDIGSEHAIMELLKDLHKSENITVVMVSHILNVVVNYARTLALIGDGLRMFGTAGEVISADSLSRVYGLPVAVMACGDARVVLAGADAAHNKDGTPILGQGERNA